MSDEPIPQPVEFQKAIALSFEAEREQMLEDCQSHIGYRFKQRELLREALTHTSIASHRLASNERMEFLGDSVLGLIVCHWLYELFPSAAEGELTRIKSTVVSRRCCARVAKALGLEPFLIVGKGLLHQQGVPISLLSDVFESIVAAIYLDGGMDQVTLWVRERLESEISEARQHEHCGNYKSALQQRTQSNSGGSASYRLLNECGPDHAKSFCVAVVVASQEFTPAWGANKKEAEQRAAANALAEMEGHESPFAPEPIDEDDSLGE